MSRLRVLQLCAVDFTVKNLLSELVEFLELKGMEVHVGCRRGQFWDDLLARGFRLVDLPMSRAANPIRQARAYGRLRRFLASNPFDIVHVHTPIAGVLGRRAARRAGVPIRIYTAHGFYFHDAMSPMTRRLCVGIERMAARWGHFIFTQSEEDRQTALRERIVASPEQILTIGNGIDTHGRFNPDRIAPAAQAALRETLGLPAGAPTIGIIARIVREKGIEELADAIAEIRRQIPRVQVLWIGGALPSDRVDATEAFRGRLERLGIGGNFHFTGFRDDVPELLSLCDLFTLPSWREGMPRSVIEAMAMRLPVVATEIRGCREEVLHGTTGYLVPMKDWRALAQRLLRLLTRPDEARRLGQAARRRAVEEFDFRAVLDRQWGAYKRLLRERLEVVI